MPKLLLINATCGIGSHGRICALIAREYREYGYEVKYAYGREKRTSDDCKEYAVRIGLDIDSYLHLIYTRVFDRHGFGSKRATKKFLKWLDLYRPDEIWLHNLHGYYINIEMLFDWLKQNPQIVVKWTLHDCWAFTGHCSYFSEAGCEKWRTQCNECPQKGSYPSSYFLDNSYDNYQRKKIAFRGIKNMTVITPSMWLADLVRESFLGDYPIKIVNNKADKDVFKPTCSDFREKHGIREKFMVLGVANVWSKRKGLNDFLQLNSLLDNRYVIVLIGLSKRQIAMLPRNIIGIVRTKNQRELAGIYSTADVYVNPSKEETFGMTGLEANLCGTPTVCYEGTACAEVAGQFNGKVVEQGVIHLYEAIKNIEEKRTEHK